MVGVAEDDLGVEVFEHVLGDGLYGSGCTHRHEDRRFNRLMREDKLGAPAAGFGLRKDVEFEAHPSILEPVLNFHAGYIRSGWIGTGQPL
jgi:hypothetical protein